MGILNFGSFIIDHVYRVPHFVRPGETLPATEYRTFAKANMDNAQGAEHAADHSAVVTRDVFSRLDTDGDGRISTTEAALDADFNGTLSTMDANSDGFVSQDEYRAHAKADMP